jgi:hypothetical protein
MNTSPPAMMMTRFRDKPSILLCKFKADPDGGDVGSGEVIAGDDSVFSRVTVGGMTGGGTIGERLAGDNIGYHSPDLYGNGYHFPAHTGEFYKAFIDLRTEGFIPEDGQLYIYRVIEGINVQHIRLHPEGNFHQAHLNVTAEIVNLKIGGGAAVTGHLKLNTAGADAQASRQRRTCQRQSYDGCRHDNQQSFHDYLVYRKVGECH